MFAHEQGSLTCDQSLGIALDMRHILGAPVVAEKIKGLSTCILYLGILMDTVKAEIKLPEDKLACLLAELDTWCGKALAPNRSSYPSLVASITQP